MTMGIYKITNKLNEQSYIGLSMNIESRWEQHIKYAFKECEDSYHKNRLYNAIRKYGVDNFSFEVIEECEKEKLQEREKYWINFYDTFNKGYNLTLGGDVSGYNVQEENHPNVKLTKNDVIDIRTRYANHERRMDVYELYKDKISLSGFVKVWQGGTWKTTMYEVYTPENKEFHKRNSAMVGDKNGRSKLSIEEAIKIKSRKDNGEKMKDVHKDYEDLYSIGYFKNIWYGNNWYSLN